MEYRFDRGADSLQLGAPLKSEEQTSSVLVSGTPGHGIASPWQSAKTWRELKKYFLSVHTQSIFQPATRCQEAHVLSHTP